MQEAENEAYWDKQGISSLSFVLVLWVGLCLLSLSFVSCQGFGLQEPELAPLRQPWNNNARPVDVFSLTPTSLSLTHTRNTCTVLTLTLTLNLNRKRSKNSTLARLRILKTVTLSVYRLLREVPRPHYLTRHRRQPTVCPPTPWTKTTCPHFVFVFVFVFVVVFVFVFVFVVVVVLTLHF